MIPNDQPHRKDMISRMLKYLCDKEDLTAEYTSWEVQFIESIHEQFLHRGDLSNKQCEILERIYDK